MNWRPVLRFLALVAVVASGSLTAAASTTAATAPPAIPRVVRLPIPAITSISARAAASNGYRFQLSGSRREPLRRETDGVGSGFLEVSLTKGATATHYSLPRGPALDGTVSASLGPLGRVDVRFVPRRTTEVPLGSGCKGRERLERGVLRGTVAFHGEGGYSDLRLGALPATRTSSPETHCTFRPNRAHAHESHESIRFGGDWRQRRDRLVDFTAKEHPRLGTATLQAYSSEQRGPVGITRSATAVVPARGAPFDQAAGTASVEATAPFTGSARFRAFPDKEAGTWLGSLAVDFPGEPGLHLAGSRYRGSLLSGDECGPDAPGAACLGVGIPSPIGLDPIRPAEASSPRR